ncbi:MAG: TRAP transporter small permease subunit [Burkholderiaceae bacterium]
MGLRHQPDVLRALFILGSGYALAKGVHIRSDFLYRSWSVRNQARVDLFLYLVFFLPTMVIFLWVSTEWAFQSVTRGEARHGHVVDAVAGADQVGTARGHSLLLLLQGISETLKSWYAATRGRWPQE